MINPDLLDLILANELHRDASPAMVRARAYVAYALANGLPSTSGTPDAKYHADWLNRYRRQHTLTGKDEPAVTNYINDRLQLDIYDSLQSVNLHKAQNYVEYYKQHGHPKYAENTKLYQWYSYYIKRYEKNSNYQPKVASYLANNGIYIQKNEKINPVL